VTVHDVTLPTIACPADISVFTTNENGTAVSFSLPSGSDSCGIASVVASPVSGSNFPVGTTVVTITATDNHGNSSQCSFNVTVGLNHAPIADDIIMGAVANHARSLLFEKMDAHCFDLDDDALTMTISATSTNGATITQSATAVTYTPMPNFVGEDRFNYTVSDGRGGITTATIIVEVSSADALTPNITGSSMAAGVFSVRFAGIPGFTYHIERTATLSPAAWAELGSIVAPEDGQVQYDDTAPLSDSVFYRTAASVP